MSINSPLDLISLALKTAGAMSEGQTPAATDVNDSFNVLNMMLASWNRKRWLLWNLFDIGLQSTGATSYTVGAGGDFNTPRPDKLEAAYSRLLPVSGASPVDFPLMLIMSYEDYSAISLKELQTFSTCIFYDGAYPLGNVFPYPVPPENQYEIHLIIKNQITVFPTLQTPISMPPEYLNCMLWNLTTRLWPLYRIQPDPIVVALAKESLNVLRQANTQMSTLRIPSSLLNGNAGVDPTLGGLNGLPWSF